MEDAIKEVFFKKDNKWLCSRCLKRFDKKFNCRRHIELKHNSKPKQPSLMGKKDLTQNLNTNEGIQAACEIFVENTEPDSIMNVKTVKDRQRPSTTIWIPGFNVS